MPGWGDPEARLLVVGLAPAAHGANRTGRMFTGDESGRWLYRALWRSGFASQPEAVRKGDGLELLDCFMSAAVRCAPPDNRPTPAERDNGRPWLEAELDRLPRPRRRALGGFATTRDGYGAAGHPVPSQAAFAHGLRLELGLAPRLLASYPLAAELVHRRPDEAAFDRVFAREREILGGAQAPFAQPVLLFFARGGSDACRERAVSETFQSGRELRERNAFSAASR